MVTSTARQPISAEPVAANPLVVNRATPITPAAAQTESVTVAARPPQSTPPEAVEQATTTATAVRPPLDSSPEQSRSFVAEVTPNAVEVDTSKSPVAPGPTPERSPALPVADDAVCSAVPGGGTAFAADLDAASGSCSVVQNVPVEEADVTYEVVITSADGEVVAAADVVVTR